MSIGVHLIVGILLIGVFFGFVGFLIGDKMKYKRIKSKAESYLIGKINTASLFEAACARKGDDEGAKEAKYERKAFEMMREHLDEIID